MPVGRKAAFQYLQHCAVFCLEQDERAAPFIGCCPFAFPHRDNAGKRWPSTNYTKEALMVQSVTYQSETKTVPFQGKSIVLESLTPVLSPKEKEKRKKDIERCLYEVFSKYRRAGDSPA